MLIKMSTSAEPGATKGRHSVGDVVQKGLSVEEDASLDGADNAAGTVQGEERTSQKPSSPDLVPGRKRKAQTAAKEQSPSRPLPPIEHEFLYVAESTVPGAGFGLFTSKRLRKNLRIGYYRGKVYKRYPSQKRAKYYRNFDYFLELTRRPPWITKEFWSKKRGKVLFVDGATDCPMAYVNCAKDDQELWNCDIRATGAFFTNVAMRAGSEIFVNYGDDYWDV